MRKLFGSLALGGALMMPLVAIAQVAVEVAPPRYYDRGHRDWHNWNDHEDRAYRAWGVERNRSYVEWNRLPARDQRNYWRWRHQHNDAALRIDVR